MTAAVVSNPLVIWGLHVLLAPFWVSIRSKDLVKVSVNGYLSLKSQKKTDSPYCWFLLTFFCLFFFLNNPVLRSFVLSEEQTINTVGQSSCNLLNRIFAFPLGDWLTTSIWTDVFSQSKFLYCSFQQQTFILLKRTGPFKTFLTTFMRVHLKQSWML